jgi:hypothetical protein
MACDDLHGYEFKIFSQWGEDGIIQGLVKKIESKHRPRIEFGVETFFEANCRLLIMNDNWRGFVWMDRPAAVVPVGLSAANVLKATLSLGRPDRDAAGRTTADSQANQNQQGRRRGS